MLSVYELAVMKDIERRLKATLAHLSRETPALEDTAAWFAYLAELKAIQGNASNRVSFVATLLAKQYLAKNYGLTGFDAAEKSQNAPGIDIDVRLPDGRRLVAELKTTNLYKEDFGHQQRRSITNDFTKLTKTEAI
jgi:hypothetical protein